MTELIPYYEKLGNLFLGDMQNGFMDATIDVRYKFAYIWNIRVARDKMGSGLAQDLSDKLVRISQENKLEQITGKFEPLEGLEDRARRFYYRNGFTIDDKGNLRKALIES